MTSHDQPRAAVQSAEPACGPCPSNEVLSEQESWILEEMGSIKEQVHPIADRLNQLEERIKSPTLHQTEDDRNAEWAKLEGQMAELRTGWRKWQTRLDEAIEQKLICLGHRAPK